MRLQHGAMQGTWRKTHIPHRIRRRDAMQQRNATFPSNGFVTAVKPPHPHKEQEGWVLFEDYSGVYGFCAALVSHDWVQV
jgi:hypothetical protein